MTNPFDDDSRDYLVLVNHEGQYSLWPDFCDVPAGWTIVGPHATRQECLSWIEQHWADMRPQSLIEQMNAAAAQRAASSPPPNA